MIKASKTAIRNAELVVFDLDGTLAPSKSAMDPEMTDLLVKLLEVRKVAIISGGKLGQFKKQVLVSLDTARKAGAKLNLKNLFLFPTVSNAFYRYERGWKLVYANFLTKEQKQQILAAFKTAFKETGYQHPEVVYGKIIEDRQTQITFSALGQEIVTVLGEKEGIRQKEAWRDTPWRGILIQAMTKYLPKGFEAQSGGLTSIDVMRKGMDKAYGIKQIEKHLKVPRRKMLFVGDAIFPGGNDYPAAQAGAPYVKVRGLEDTKNVVRMIVG